MEVKLGRYALRSTVGQISEFMKSVLWLDMQDILEDWREDIRTNLETTEGNELLKFQGRADVIRRCLVLPQTMMEVIEDELGLSTADRQDRSRD